MHACKYILDLEVYSIQKWKLKSKLNFAALMPAPHCL